MKSRLNRRGILALIIYFMMITVVCAPIAFNVGKARGVEQMLLNASESQSDTTEAPDYESLIRARRAGAGCGGISDPAIERKAFWEVICHPESKERLNGPRLTRVADDRLPRAARPRSGGPLEQAVARAIAADGFAGPDGLRSGGGHSAAGQPPLGNGVFTPGDPLSLALAPDLGGGAGGPGAGRAPSPNGAPPALIPNNFSVSGPPDDVVVTPIPGALPLLLTGVFGFFFAARGRKR